VAYHRPADPSQAEPQGRQLGTARPWGSVAKETSLPALKIPNARVSKEFLHAVQALYHSGYLLRGDFVQLAEGKPVEEILDERGASLERAEQVIDTWAEFFGEGEQDVGSP
jgi:hypothetical protein